MRYNQDGWRLCDQEGCEQAASHHYVWAKEMACCWTHMFKVLELSQAMGFPTPMRTLRPLLPSEMRQQLDEESDQS